MDDLITFLRARLDEDEQTARDAVQRGWRSEDNYLESDTGEVARFKVEADARHAAVHDPARALADVEVKRRIVELHEGEHECSTYDENGERDPCTYVLHPRECSTLLLIAQVYADHPDYRDEWRP